MKFILPKFNLGGLNFDKSATIALIPCTKPKAANVLIMSSTREVALQIEKEVNKYSFRDMKAVCIYGGGSRLNQIVSVEPCDEIIICTPGRVNGLRPLAKSYMADPIIVPVGSLDFAVTRSVKQIIDIITSENKFQTVLAFAQQLNEIEKAIIFCGLKSQANDLQSDFILAGIPCQYIYGSRDSMDGEQAISDISTGEVNILIITDVASRGFDIKDITHVINYDFPKNVEYIHRVERTGRPGRTGFQLAMLHVKIGLLPVI